MEYCEKSVGFDESSICNIVMKIRLINCGWLKLKEMDSYEWKCLIWALWKEYIVLFDFHSVHSYVTHLLHFGHHLEYNSLYMLTCVCISMGESLAVDRMYLSS